MTRYVSGYDVFENCGPFVIVEEATLTRLEEAAPIIRSLLGRASRTATVAEMGELLDQLTLKRITPEWQEIAEDEFNITDFAHPRPKGLYKRCVGAYFLDSDVGWYSSYLLVASAECHSAMIAPPEVSALVRRFAAVSRWDDAAGFESLTEPVRALEAAGHTCVRDDERIANVFDRLMSDAYLRADELPDEDPDE